MLQVSIKTQCFYNLLKAGQVHRYDDTIEYQ